MFCVRLLPEQPRAFWPPRLQLSWRPLFGFHVSMATPPAGPGSPQLTGVSQMLMLSHAFPTTMAHCHKHSR